jgi:EAL domain-containing protein (putative c-di-GMP-specific phosphodiesterase class I)/GGDEF domain-containing protein
MDEHCQLTEARRIDALYKLELLDTAPSEAFDRITRMAARLFDLPIAAISLTDTDRQWFKSRVGVAHTSIPRLRAPCASVTDEARELVVPDLLTDDFFRDSHLAHSGVRFYAGAPLTTPEGHCLGAMCVLGPEPRQFTEEERASLVDLAAMVMAQIELQHAIGRIDAISGLPNRNQFIEDFRDLQMDRPAGEQRLAAVINLTTPEQLSTAARAMSPAYLDRLVADAARWIRGEIGAHRKVYQVADAQFALIAPPGIGADAYCVKLVEVLRRSEAEAKSRYIATITVGVAPFVVGQTDALDVLRTAHSAAQDAVDHPDHVAVYSPAEDAAYRRRFALLSEFGVALDSGDQLHLVFQPRVDLRSGHCVGVEALLRWTHPRFGPVSPGEFIPVIERSPMARAATSWVIESALRQQSAWRGAGLRVQMAVNVSAANLLEPDFIERVTAGLARHGLPPNCLELEITESAIMEHPKRAHATLDAIAGAGIGLAIDDFGTGYSSLSYLQSMPADVVKIDQSFLRDIEHDERKRTLVATMITLSHDLGHRVVAEGVETAAARAFLESVGCDEAQGYLFARPMLAEVFSTWIRPDRPAPALQILRR